jgi:hypothetical protein
MKVFYEDSDVPGTDVDVEAQPAAFLVGSRMRT